MKTAQRTNSSIKRDAALNHTIGEAVITKFPLTPSASEKAAGVLTALDLDIEHPWEFDLDETHQYLQKNSSSI
jgi:hypothetical protein